MKRITGDVDEADREIIPLLREFGRCFIAGFSVGETEADRDRKIKELSIRLRRMIVARDEQIFKELTESQRKTFDSLQGKQLNIEWAPGEMARTPFWDK